MIWELILNILLLFLIKNSLHALNLYYVIEILFHEFHLVLLTCEKNGLDIKIGFQKMYKYVCFFVVVDTSLCEH